MGFMTLVRAQWDRAAAIGATLVGLIALLLGWIGVSGTGHIAKQIPFIVSGGIAGIVFVAIGAVLWVSADLRDEWRELRRLRVQLDGLTAQPASDFGSLEPAAVELTAVRPGAAEAANGQQRARRTSSRAGTVR